MQALILAGGEGSRLAASGIGTPKVLVPVHGVPQLQRIMTACRQVGCIELSCAIRAEFVDDARPLTDLFGARVIALQTANSLETMVAALRVLPPGPLFCVLVDTVIPDLDWIRAHAAAAMMLTSVDAVVAVTPYVNDEKPLWVDATVDGLVTSFGARGAQPMVTGGMYWLSQAARESAIAAFDRGVERLRGFLTELVVHGGRVAIVVVPKMIDIDNATDLEEAAALLEAAHG